MFRGLFGSKDTQSPQPPKNQIEVVCPVCGAAQYEPRLVVSSFCKRCGVHLKIEKKRVTASEVSKAGGKPEAMEPRKDLASSSLPAAAVKNVVAGPRPSTGPLMPMTSGGAMPLRSPVPTLFIPPPTAEDTTSELGLGAMMQAVASRCSTPLEASPSPANEPLQTIADSEAQTEELTGSYINAVDEMSPTTDDPFTTSIAGNVPMSVREIMNAPVDLASNQSAFQKMRDQGLHRNHHFKEAQCFECDNKFKVGRSSRSANCPSCGAYISLEDVELNMPSTQVIKTRGDVLIRKRGHLTATDLFARDLRCFGIVSANIHCSGDAIFKSTGTVIGEVHCRKFIVEKGADLQFMNEIHADEIEINAPVKGHFFSKGKLSILGTGAVDGGVTGRSINIEPGGELNGSMNILRATA